MSTTHPHRGHALTVLFVSLLLALLTLYRIVSEDFSLGLGWVILLACAILILIAGYVAFVQKSVSLLNIRFENGETVSVSTESVSRATKMQNAIHDALDSLDYHDTDDARPTVVLASLEPTKLTPVGGPVPDVVKVNDETAQGIDQRSRLGSKLSSGLARKKTISTGDDT